MKYTVSCSLPEYDTRMGYMISSPATPTVCLEQKSKSQRDIIDAVTI